MIILSSSESGPSIIKMTWISRDIYKSFYLGILTKSRMLDAEPEKVSEVIKI